MKAIKTKGKKEMLSPSPILQPYPMFCSMLTKLFKYIKMIKKKKKGKITYRDRTNLLATGKTRLCAGVCSKVKMGIRADKLWLVKKQDYSVKFCRSF